jgi:hypothetical protein
MDDVIARSPKGDEAIPVSHGQVKRDCFAEFILGLAEGKTRGLAMTRNYFTGRTRVAGVNWSARAT